MNNIFIARSLLALPIGLMQAELKAAEAPSAYPMQRAGADNSALFDDPRIIRQEELRESFDSSRSRVRVIVGLESTPEIAKFNDWRDAARSRQFRENVVLLQEVVLGRVLSADVILNTRYENIPAFACTVTMDGMRTIIAESSVRTVELDEQASMQTRQGIPLMNISPFQRTTWGGAGLSIAICDSGLDYDHTGLGGGGFPNAKVIGGYDTGDDDNDPKDAHGHGTPVAGIAVGDDISTGNADYIGGVAPGAKVYALKVTYSGGGGKAYLSDVAESWDWCVTHQYDDPSHPILIINTSYGGGKYGSACDGSYPTFVAAAGNAVSAGITVFVSSGNDGYCSSIATPACVSDVISVGGVFDADVSGNNYCVEQDSCVSNSGSGCSSGYSCSSSGLFGTVACYSNSASFLDLLAPLHRATTLKLDGGTKSNFGGTSASSPYAAGAGAILQSRAIDHGFLLTPQEIRDALVNGGDPTFDTKNSVIKPRINVGTSLGLIPLRSIWLEANTAPPWHGTETYPVISWAVAKPLLNSGGDMHVKAGTVYGIDTIHKKMTITAEGGLVKLMLAP